MSAILDSTFQVTLNTPVVEDRPTLTFFDLFAAVAEVTESEAESFAIVLDLIRSGQVRVPDLPMMVLPEPDQLD